MPIPLTFLITDLELGGSPLIVRALARGLQARGRFAPTVVSLASGGEVARLLKREGIPTLGLGAQGPRDLPTVLGRWREVLHQTRPRIVQSVLIHANLVATLGRALNWGVAGAGQGRTGRVKYLQSIHTLQPKPRWHWYLQGVISAFADGMWVPERGILRALSAFSLYFSCPFVVQNGIGVTTFAAATAPEDLPWGPNSCVIGYVGRFDPVKRVDVLIEAFADLLARNTRGDKDLHLALVGYGEQEGALRQLVEQSGVAGRVHFLGRRLDVERWYKSFSCLCLPSPVEGFGLTVVEAMAAGAPVVAMDTPVLRRVTGGHARLVSDLSAKSLTLALQEVIAESLADPQAAKTRAAAACAWVAEHFNAESMVERYEQNLEQFLRD